MGAGGPGHGRVLTQHIDLKDETRELIYNYLDLTNEQVYLRSKRRIRKDTWADWCAGIQEHLQKDAFKAVWDEVKTEAPDCFTSLMALEESGFKSDPAEWR